MRCQVLYALVAILYASAVVRARNRHRWICIASIPLDKQKLIAVFDRPELVQEGIWFVLFDVCNEHFGEELLGLEFDVQR
jgi:hypothetical protein